MSAEIESLQEMLSRATLEASKLQISYRELSKKSEVYYEKAERYMKQADEKIKQLEIDLNKQIELYSTFDVRLQDLTAKNEDLKSSNNTLRIQNSLKEKISQNL